MKESSCEKVKKEKIKDSTRRTVKEFARSLIKAIESYKTQQDKDYLKFLKVPEEERETVSVEYPLYEQSQACYAINKLIEKEGKIFDRTSYVDGERMGAEFTDIEVKRNKFETLQTAGKIFFTWKGMRCVASVFFQGNYAEAHFVHPKKDREKMKKFQEALRRFRYEHNYFRGEKLEYLSYSRLTFLKYPKLGWESLILKKELKDEIDLNLLFPINNEKLCKKHKIPWRRGLLLAGVPGTGKTQLGRVLCNMLDNVTIIWATAKAIHDSGRVKTLFEIARKFAPTLIIMEDIDFFGQDREFHTNPIVGEMLNQLDGSAPNDGVFILATTNRPYLLDKALADRPSRFDVKLLFGTPDLEERKQMVKLFAQGKNLAVSEDYIAEVTNKLTGSHIKEVINYATLLALRNGEEQITKDYIDRAYKKIKEKLEQTKNRMVA